MSRLYPVVNFLFTVIWGDLSVELGSGSFEAFLQKDFGETFYFGNLV